jgi:hypothetical protein
MLGVFMIMTKPFLTFLFPLLIGILAICLGMWYERKKGAERKGRGWKYLMFSVIGILSFFAGFYLGDEMHLGYLIFKATGGLLAIFPFALTIYAVLFFLGLYISREHSLGFGLKVFGLSFLFFFLAFYGLMAYGAHEHYYAKYISVEKFGAPKEYLNIAEEELEKYPFLKEAIEVAYKNKSSKINLHPEKWLQLEASLGIKDGKTIKIGEEYYKVHLLSGLIVQKYEILPSEYVNITKEELEEYQALKKAIEDANKSEDGRAGLKVHPDEWGRIQAFLTEKGSYNIKVGDEYYEVGFICA